MCYGKAYESKGDIHGLFSLVVCAVDLKSKCEIDLTLAVSRFNTNVTNSSAQSDGAD